MAGNVWEWTSSLYKPYPYVFNDGRENLSDSGDRVLRGGSWNYLNYLARSAYRNDSTPDNFDNFIGFRCARSLP
jgi:formylglycine-generating enzyme required for sulfatase activity